MNSTKALYSAVPKPAQTRPWSLRPATVADTGDIARVWHRGWLDGHLGHVPRELVPHRTFESFLARVPPRLHTTTVITHANVLLGFVTVQEDEVEQMYVAAEARGTGAAGALLQNAEEVISERFDRAWLAVVVGNARARRFYARQGWQDGGALEYSAEIIGGAFPVETRRYEKPMSPRR